MRIATLSLLVLCLALVASAQAPIYQEGPIDGNDNAFFVTGPNYPNIAGSFQDISNGFVATTTGSAEDFSWGEWSVGAPTGFSVTFGTAAFGNGGINGCPGGNCQFDFVQNPGNSTLLFTNGFGYGIYNVHVLLGANLEMTAGNTYWVTVSNATDAANDGTQAWDIPNGGLGGPAICNFRQSGTNYGDCGLGGESFTISSGGTTPEPSSILLFGSGILGLAGVLRRKLTR
jgi:hypothetical protein